MKKYVSLTFDDGPNLGEDTTMSDMLDILEKHQVTASFFLIGSKISDKNTPVILRALNMGCDIENHTWSHRAMTELTAPQIKEEFSKADDAILKITHKRPAFFRPPYIAVNQTVFDTVPLPFICGHGCRDWENEVSADERLKLLMDGMRDGIMLLLHVSDGNTKTVEVVDRLIPILKAQDYEFVTVPDLFRLKSVSPAQPGKLWTVVEGAEH